MKDQLSRSDNEHGNVPHQLAAYVSHELEKEQRLEVELHLAVCNDCQQRLLELQQPQEPQQEPVLTHSTYKRARRGLRKEAQKLYISQLASAVLTTIAEHATEAQQVQKRSVRILLARTLSRLLPQKTMTPRERINFRVTLAVSMALLITVLVSAFAFGNQSKPQTVSSLTPTPQMVPAANWALLPGQTTVQGAHNSTFSIKSVSGTAREFRFFYAFSIPQPVSLTVYASSSSQQGTSIRSNELTTVVQPLGTLGSFWVGVIHINRLDQVGQTLHLIISAKGAQVVTWFLSPLKQFGTDPATPFQLDVDPNQLPTIEWYGPVTAAQVAFFKGPDQSHVCVRSDDPSTVTVITQDQYIALAGNNNFF